MCPYESIDIFHEFNFCNFIQDGRILILNWSFVVMLHMQRIYVLQDLTDGQFCD